MRRLGRGFTSSVGRWSGRVVIGWPGHYHLDLRALLFPTIVDQPPDVLQVLCVKAVNARKSFGRRVGSISGEEAGHSWVSGEVDVVGRDSIVLNDGEEVMLMVGLQKVLQVGFALGPVAEQFDATFDSC